MSSVARDRLGTPRRSESPRVSGIDRAIDGAPSQVVTRLTAHARKKAIPRPTPIHASLSKSGNCIASWQCRFGGHQRTRSNQ
jgi:hypothetical protein